MFSRYVSAGLFMTTFSLALAVPTASAASPAPQSEPRTAAVNAALAATFTYQGEVRDGGEPIDGHCDFRFQLFGDADGGEQIGRTISQAGVPVSDGRFSALLNSGGEFGADAFMGEARWLRISLRCPAGVGAYTALSPRQSLTAAPYAQFAKGAPWTGLLGLPDDFADGQDNDLLGGLSCGDAQVPKWSGGRWSCADDADTLPGEAGIVELLTGEGLSGGGSGRSVGISLDTTFIDGRYALREDLSRAGGSALHWDNLIGLPEGFLDGKDDDSLAGLGCAENQIVKRIGARWRCADEAAPSGGTRWSDLIGMPSGFADGRDDTDDQVSWSEVSGLTGDGPGELARGDHQHFGVDWRGTSNRAGLRVENRQASAIVASASGKTGQYSGIWASSDSAAGTGVYGVASAGGFAMGVRGEVEANGGYGLYGLAKGTAGTGTGLYAETRSSGGYAGYFKGRTHVNGRLSKSAGSFKIDHPQDPANKYLSHSFVESPDMKNIYDGVAALGAEGEAWIELPGYFEALNADFRYQLTPIGSAMPGLYVSEPLSGNRFRIAGGTPEGRVSWQVTGIRIDPYAQHERIPVEEDKPESEIGTYLYPEGYDQPASAGLDTRHRFETETQAATGEQR